MTPEQIALVQEQAATLKRRAESLFNACTAEPRDEKLIANESGAMVNVIDDARPILIQVS